MLLWIPSPAGAAAAHHHNNHHHLDDEKGDKLRRRAAEARYRNILMVAGLFILAFFATVSQVQYTQKRHQLPALRIPGGGGGDPNEPVLLEETSPDQQQAKEAADRMRKVPREEKEEESSAAAAEQPDDFFVPHSHLPEDSIYRLTMTDVTGNKVDLSQFVGMVSLVVNTACH